MRTLLHLSAGALKAFAAKWFLLGFKLSGRGFHGENYDADKYPALTDILLAEFERVYGTDRKLGGIGEFSPRPTHSDDTTRVAPGVVRGLRGK